MFFETKVLIMTKILHEQYKRNEDGDIIRSKKLLNFKNNPVTQFYMKTSVEEISCVTTATGD